MLNICRLWTTRHFPISAAGRALDHQSIHLLTSTTASPLTILSTKNFTTISKSKRRAGSSSRWVHCTSAFPSQTQMTRRSSRSSRLSSRRSVSRMNPPTATRISMPQGWSSAVPAVTFDEVDHCCSFLYFYILVDRPQLPGEYSGKVLHLHDASLSL